MNMESPIEGVRGSVSGYLANKHFGEALFQERAVVTKESCGTWKAPLEEEFCRAAKTWVVAEK